MKTSTLFISLVCGFVAGAALIMIELGVPRKSVIVLPYAALAIALMVCLRSAGVQSFFNRFVLSMLAFTTATVMLYAYVDVAVRRLGVTGTVWGRSWPLLVMLAIGVAISSAIASVPVPRSRTV